ETFKTVALETLLPLIEDAFSRGQTVILPVTGGSMRPTLDQGDTVTIVPVGDTVRRGDVLLYRRPTGQFVLHRAVRVHRSTVDFCGDAQIAVEKGIGRQAVIAKAVCCTHGGQTFGAEYLYASGKKRLRSRPFRSLATAFHRALRR
ncbi:MAG: S24/S26 family peptidase, partial [Acutalibacteraceae bacterium]